MKLKRTPRKLIRLSEAAALLQISRSSVRNMIDRGEIVAIQPKPGTTSPIKVFYTQVETIAKEWQIL